MKIYDLSPLISHRTGVFPGDTRFRRTVALDIDKGHPIGLSMIETTLHLGAHADAPNHYARNAQGIHQRDLTRYFGRCQVMHARGHERGDRIGAQHLPRLKKGMKRVLVRTESFPDPDNWNSDFCSYDPQLIQSWADQGVLTIGIDTPSIDPESSKDLPSHAAVAKGDLSILEGLVLNGVPEGEYTLIALPLKLENADASPVRAILVDPFFVSESDETELA